MQAVPRILTIDDDEPRPQVSLALTDDAIGERAGSTTVRATVDVAPAESIHLTLAAEPVAPAVAGDFRQQGSTLAFARGALASTGTVTVTAVDNDVDAPARSVRIGATVARGYAAPPPPAVLSITDDEAAPTVNLLLDPAAISEHGGHSRVTARLDHPSSTPTTVTVTTAPVAPAQAADFTQLGSTLTIAAGARASTGTVLVTALDNAVFGPPRTLQVAGTADNDHGVTAPAARELAIDEDDAPPLVKIEMTDLQMPEAAGSVAVMVTFEDPVTEEVVYTVSATPLGAADAGDFSLSANRALTIAAGATASSGTVTVTALPNEVDAPDRTIQVAATGGFPGLPEPAPAKLTITDDDAAPAVTLQVHPSATIDERRAVAAVTAALDHPSSEDTTVRVTVAPVAPAVAADFTQEGTALRIRAGATTGSTTVRITAVDNDVDAPDKTLTVAAEAANLHGVAGNPAPLTLTVTDDEAAPAVRLLLDPAAIGENGGESRVTARLDHRSSAATVVTVTAASVAPALASHFTQAGSTLTIAAGQRRSAGTVRITAVDDDLYGPTREVTVSGTATNDQGLAGAPAARSLAIREDEPAPLLTLALTVEEIDEDGGTAGITATIDRAMNQELTYTVSAAVQGPAAGDFTLSAEPVLTFPTGHTASAGTVTITALADDVDAPDRTVRVAAEGGFPGLPVPQPKLLTILDDDAPPAVTLAVDPEEIAENGGSAAVTAALDHPSSADTTVRVAVAPAAPATAADYTQRGTTLRIPAGERTGSGTVWVTAVDNDVDAPARTLSITGAAANAQGLAGQPAPVTLTVADDDAAPAVSLLLSHPQIVENGGETTVTARLDHPASVATTVTVTTTPQPPALAADFTQAGSTLTIAPGTRSSTGVVRISAVDNRLDAPDRTLTVSAAAVSAREVTGPAPRTLTIADDEPTPTVALLLTDNHLGENGGLTTVTARLDHPTIEATIVTVAARALPPALATDFALSANRALTIAARHTTSTGIVELATVDNEVDAPDKRVQVSATVAGGSGAPAPRVRTLTILDDEGAPTVTLALTDPEIAEGGTTTLRARLSAATSQTVSMRIAAAPHVTLSDYPVLTILPHHVTSGRAVTVTAAVDDVDAPDRTVELGTSLFNAPAGIVAPDAVSLRIMDDDETPAVTLVLSASAIDENGGESMVSARLSHPSSDDTTVTVTAAAGSPGAPYFARHGSTLTIPSGARDSTGQVRITSVNDVLDAPDRTVVISGQAHNPRAVTGPAPETLTILDDELLPAVTLELAPGTILEAGGSSTVTAALSGPSSAAVTVTVSVTPHAPAVDDDFRLSANRVLTIAAGARRAGGTLTITAVDNTGHEADKTLQVTAAVSGGHGVAPPPPRTLTVLEDDSEQIRVWLELDPAIATEGGEVQVRIRKSRAGGTGLSYALVDGDLYDLSETPGEELFHVFAADLEGSRVRPLRIARDGAHGLPRTEWVRVTPRGGSTPVEPALLTVLDRDQPPAVTVIVTRPKIFEDGGETAVVAYLHGTDTRLSREDTTVTLTALPTPPATAADFTLSTTTLTIPAGEHTSAEAVFTAVNNGLDNANKRVRIRADAHNPAGVGMPGAVVVDIIDDEPAPTARLKLSPAAIGEANGVSAVTVVLDAPSANDTAVAVSAMPVTPARGADFTLGADSVLTVAARALESSGTVFITARDNVIAAPDKQVLLVPAVIAGRAAAGRAATLTILDDDTAPAVTLHLQPASIAENGGVAGVTATLDRAPGEVATVTVSATAVQPAVAADFSLSAGRVLTIAADATASTGTVRITARDNAAAGPPKLVLVEAVVSGGNGAAAPPPRTLTIVDDDVAPAVTLTVSPQSIAENGGVAEVTAALDRAASEATTVTVTATAVAPAAAGDFSVSGGPVLTIAMGDTASGATVRITAQDNAATGPPRQVRVEAVVSGGDGAAAPAPRTLTIVDDEVAPTVTLTLSPERIGEAGGSSAVTATYAPPPAASTTVTIRASAPESPLAAGFELRGSTLVFAAGVADSTNTVHIAALDDDLDAPDTTVSVTAAAHTGRVEAAARTLTIEDDDPTPVLTLALAPDTVDEGGVSTVTAALDGRSSAATVVTVAAAAQAPAQASDFALSANTALTIAPGARNSAGRVWIEALPNTVDEEQDARSVTVSAHVSGGRGVQPPAPRTLTIRDDDHTISGICARSRRVKEGILEQLGGISCEAVTAEHLAAVSQLLLTGTAPTAHNLLAGDFAGLTNLTYLDLSYGQVGSLLEGIFSGLAKLEYLGLAGNYLDSLPEGIFFGLRNLHLLNLAGNDLIRLPERVFRDVDLWELDLGENDLVTLPANVFSGQPRLYLLDLIGNDIATLPSAAFAGLSGLKFLLLHGNELTSLPAGIFADLRSLRRIYLVGNKLTGIAADQLVGMPVLEILDLRDNELTALAADAFIEVPSLDILRLIGNNLTELPANVFHPLRRLRHLYLYDNQLGTLPAGIFSRNLRLWTVELYGNPLTSLPADLLSGLPELRHVRLGAPGKPHHLSSLPERTFAGLPAPLRSLNLFSRDHGADFPLEVSLRAEGSGRFRAVAASGAPFDIVLPVSVINGTIDGGAATVTIPAGAVHSAALQVTRIAGTTAAIDADIGALPEIPSGGESRVPNSYDPRTDEYLQATTGHWGYRLTKAVVLPVAVDERPQPRVELVLAPPAVAEDGGVSRVTARLASAVTAPVTLAVAAAPLAPALARDFSLGGAALTIAAGTNESIGTVTVTAVADEQYVPGKRVAVTAAVTGGPALPPAPRLLAIGEDDAAPVVSLWLSTDTIAEDGGVVEVTASLGHAVRDDVTVTVAATPAAPARDADIRQFRTKLWIAAGSTASSTTVRIEAANNQVDEPDKTVQVAGTVSGVADLSAPAPRTFTIEDDDEGRAFDPAGNVPRVSLELSRDAIGEKEGSTAVTARLDRRSGADTTVQVTATALQPPSGEYFTQAGTTLTIRAGADRSTGTVTITARDDTVDNPHRTVRVAGAAGNDDGVVDPPARTLTIVDDELLPALALALSQSRISENGGSSAVTASLSGGSSELLQVTVVAVAAGTVAGGFELSADPVLTVAAHATASSGTVTVTGRNDEVYTGDRTVSVSGTVRGGNGVAPPAPHELTVVDDETPPTVTLLLSANRIDENGGRTTVTASLSGADLGVAAVLTVTATPHAPATVDDFTQAGATLTIAAGGRASTGTVTIAAHDNELDGPHKTVQVAASLSGVPGLPAPAAQTLTIVDDDATPTLTLVLSPRRVGENGGVSVVTATLSERSGVDTTLTVAATPHAPAAGSYFVQHGTTLTIAAGHTASAGTVRIEALDDNVDSPDKQVRVAAAVAGGNGMAAPAAQFLTILDGETTPRVSLVLATPSIAENGGASLVQATLDRASSEDTTLAVAATPHEPAAGSYFVQHGTTLTITAGHTASAGTVRIEALDDATDSPGKQVRVAATVAGGNGAMAPAPRVLQIRDDDATPTLELELSPDRIGEAQGESVITATLSAASSADTTLWITAAPDPPATVDDFTLSANLVLTIAAGQTASGGEVKITAVDDAVDAPDKTLQVAALVSGGNGVAAPAATPLTIADDEPTPTAALKLSADTIGEHGGVATVWATLSGVSSEDAVFTVAAAPLEPPAGQYFTQTGATLTIAAGEITSSGEVKIVAQDDEAAGPDKRVRVSATISGGNGIAAPAARELRILDGEATPVVELALSEPAIGEHGGVTTVTARLPHASTRATTLTVAVTAVAPAAAGDFALSPNRVLTIAALATSSSGTVTVTGVDNDVDAPDKNLWVTAVAAGGDGVAAPQRKALKILDDEATPVVTLKLSAPAIGENGGTATVTASLDVKSSRETTVAVTASAASPALATYFSVRGTSLTIAPGAHTSSGEVVIEALSDAVHGPDKRVRVAGAASNGHGVEGPAAVQLTITDDDALPAVELLLDPDPIDENGGVTTVTARLAHPVTARLLLTVAAAPSEPATGAYFTQAGTLLTLAPGTTDSSGLVTVTAVDDAVYGPDKIVALSATAAGGNGVAAPPARRLTIADDEALPAAVLVLDPSVIGEHGGDSTVTARLAHPVSEAAVLTVAATLEAPAAGHYFTQTGSTLTIARGATESTGAVTLAAADDTVAGTNKIVRVAATLTGGNGVAAPDAQRLTIVDDDGAPTVTLELSPEEIVEDGGVSIVTAILSGASSRDTTLQVAVTPRAPAVRTDFSLSDNLVLTIAATGMQSTGTVTVTSVGDDVDGPNKTLRVAASILSNDAVAAPQPRELTIADDEATPTVTLLLDGNPIDENGGVSTVTATLSGTSIRDTTVTVTATPLPPATAEHFRQQGSVLSIAAGSTASTGVVKIEAVNDSGYGPDRVVRVAGTAANPHGVEQPAAHDLTIADDEAAPTVTLVLSPPEIAENGGAATVAARLAHTASEDTALQVFVTPLGTAAARDFAVTGNVALTIAAGHNESTGTVTVTAVDDDVDGPDKRLQVAATVAGGNGVAAPAAQVLTIRDDEAAPRVTLELSEERIGEDGGASTVTATLSGPSSEDTTVTIAATPLAGALAADFALSGNLVLTIAARATASSGEVVVTAVDDDVDGPDKRLRVAGTAANAHAVADPIPRELTIIDDEATPRATLALSEERIGEDGGASTVTATLSGTSTEATTLTVTAWPVAPPAGEYFTQSGTTLTIAPGSTESIGEVVVAAVNDRVHGADKRVQVAATVAGGRGVAAPAARELAISEDDPLPQVTLLLSSGDVIDEDGGTATVTALLDRRSSAEITVTVSATPLEPAAGAYFSQAGTTLVIAADSLVSRGVVRITAVDDAVDAPHKRLLVGATVAGGNGVAAPASRELTIADDEPTPVATLVLSAGDIPENGGIATVTATLTGASSQPTTLAVTATPFDPATGDYFTQAGTALTIATGRTESTGAVTIAARDDDEDGADKTVQVAATAFNSHGVAEPAAEFLRILDNEAIPAMSFELSREEIDEDGGTSTVTAVLDHPSEADTEVTISVSIPKRPAGGGANLRSVQAPRRSRSTKSVRAQGRDLGPRSSPPPPPPPPYHLDGDLVQTILAGQTRAQPVEITWVDDEVDGPDTTVTFAATVENDLRVRPPRSAQIKVNDDDDTPAVTLHLAPDAIAEDGGATVVTATLDRLSSADTTVRVSAAPVAPAQAGDFALSGDTVLTIAAQADTSSGTLTITALDNDVDAAPKTVTVSGKASNDQGVIDPADVTLTIEDDDHSPVFGAATPRAVAENTAAGTDIGAPVAATDQDAGDTLSYRLLGTDAAVFDVVAATGQLRTEAALDYEARDAYTVTVEADDGNGNRGDVSVTIDVTDVDEPPGKPAAPTVTAASVTSLRVTWTAPANRGPPIEDYDYRYRTDAPEGSWTEVVDTTLTVLTATIGSLSENTAYDVAVRATNDEGTGEWSEPGTGATDANAAPEFTAASARFEVAENRTAVGTVQASDGDPEDSVSGYTLSGGVDQGLFELDEMTGALAFKAASNHEVPLDAESTTPANAAGNNEYVLEVSATSGSGEREKTTPRTVVVAVTNVAEAPGKPDPPVVTALSPVRLEVTWTAPANAGPAIEDYDYRYRTDAPEGSWTEVVDTTLTVLTATIGSLNENTAYDVAVRATNDEGTGEWSEPGTGATDANAAPAFTPESARFEVAENRTAVGTVQASDSDPEDSVSGYTLSGGVDQGLFELDEMTGALAFKAAPNHEVPLDAESTTPANAAGNNEYVLEVSATSGSGEREKTTPRTVVVTVMDEPEPPAAPDAPTVVAASVTSVRVTWTAPANAGPAIEDYDYRSRTDDPEGSWTEVTGTTLTVLTATIGSLNENTAYDVAVRATNDEGTGEWSEPGTGATDANAAPEFTPASAEFEVTENQTENRRGDGAGERQRRRGQCDRVHAERRGGPGAVRAGRDDGRAGVQGGAEPRGAAGCGQHHTGERGGQQRVRAGGERDQRQRGTAKDHVADGGGNGAGRARAAGEAGRPHGSGDSGDQPAGDVDGAGQRGAGDRGLRLPLPGGRSGGKLDGGGGHRADGADGEHRLAEREHGLRRGGAGDERRGHRGVVGAGYGSDGRQRGAGVHAGIGCVRGGGEHDRGGDGAGERQRRRGQRERVHAERRGGPGAVRAGRDDGRAGVQGGAEPRGAAGCGEHHPGERGGRQPVCAGGERDQRQRGAAEDHAADGGGDGNQRDRTAGRT